VVMTVFWWTTSRQVC